MVAEMSSSGSKFCSLVTTRLHVPHLMLAMDCQPISSPSQLGLIAWYKLFRGPRDKFLLEFSIEKKNHSWLHDNTYPYITYYVPGTVLGTEIK